MLSLSETSESQSGFIKSFSSLVLTSRQLAMRTLVYLKSHGQMSKTELDKVLMEVQNCPETVSISQISDFLRKHTQTYRPKAPAPVAQKKELTPQNKKEPAK